MPTWEQQKLEIAMSVADILVHCVQKKTPTHIFFHS